MRQALGIIYGSNIGTTMTGWLVAVVGFKFDIQALALPMIGVGMVMKLTRRNGQVASLGLALVGFGLFFVGIDVLKSAFEGLVVAFDISKYSADGISGVLLFLLIGIVMTILTQSSSASIALTITAASTGMVGLYAAGAMVIGANVGTTSTAIIASIGATSNAKRVAAAQVVFNLTTAVIALLVLPVLFYLIEKVSHFFSVNADAAISLALFHTVFNVLGVLLVYPQNERLALLLEKRFRSWDETQSHPRFLDKTIAQTPVLAVNALLLELQSIADKVMALYVKAIDHKANNALAFEHEAKVIKVLSTEVSKFIATIESSALSPETTANLATLMRIDQYFLSCTLSVERIIVQLEQRKPLDDTPLERQIQGFFNQLIVFMRFSREKNETVEHLNNKYLEIQTEHEAIKAKLILEGTLSQVSVAQMSESIDCISEVLRLSQQWHKGLTRLSLLELTSGLDSSAQLGATPAVLVEAIDEPEQKNKNS